MSYAAEDDEALEHTLLIVREVSVYKIPARSSSGGYKCAEWLQSDKIWTGRLKVISLKEKCEVRLEDPNTGELFAACPVLPGKRDATVENVADSSRYFVLRIDDGRGKHAFIGLGFAERNEAFDFNVALSDHEKYVKREAEKEQHGFDGHDGRDTSHPSLDLRLKEGETIKINVKTKPASGTGMLSGATGSSNVSIGRMKAPLAPPPGGGRIRSPLPPPPSNDSRNVHSFGSGAELLNPTRTGVYASNMASTQALDRSKHTGRADPFTDLSHLKSNLPATSTTSSSTNGRGAGGWAAF
ncbi:unnamed protein product [Sphagnum troendelagicum]|uniref:NECAP PHear domain-containing protein n=1 Tax=Sphagnum troendelagicum TaxID=128251 RepID=A0ABP0V8K0_9BRYO